MPTVTFTESDIKKSEQMSAGWCKLQLKVVGQWKPGKTDPTANVSECEFIVKEGVYKDVPIKHWFSEKQMDRVAGFIKCFLASGKVEVGKSYELSELVGSEVMGFCMYDPGMKWNKIEDFRAVDKKASA